jgi:hypothetical protein
VDGVTKLTNIRVFPEQIDNQQNKRRGQKHVASDEKRGRKIYGRLTTTHRRHELAQTTLRKMIVGNR